jgi:polysaccharide biosynthesis transport protein
MNSISSHSTPPSSLQPINNGDLLFQEQEAGNFRDYWIIVRKYRWTIAIFWIFIVLIAVLSIGDPPPTYTATASLHLENQTPNIMGAIGFSSVLSSGSGSVVDYYKTQTNLLRSRSMVAQIIRDLGLDQGRRLAIYAQDPPSFIESQVSWLRSQVRWGLGLITSWVGMGEEDLEDTVGEEGNKKFEFGVHPSLIDIYLSRLAIERVPETQIIKVSFTSLLPSFSKRVAKAHVSAFIRTNLLTRFELTAEGRQFLEEKLTGLKATLERSEGNLNRFRKAHAIVSLEKGENLVVDRLRGLNADLTQARSRKIELESLYHVIQQRGRGFLSQIIENPVVRQIKDQISALEIEKARLASTFRPTYPGVTALQEQIDQAKNRMDQEVHRIVRSITSDYEAAKAREQALTEAMEEQRRAALDLREKAVEAAVLEREVESDRALYDTVLKRSKETDLTGEVPVSNMRVVDQADTPLWPDNTSKARSLLLSMAVGLLGGVGVAFLRNYLDNTLKTPEDIGRFLHLPTLGLVPNVEQIERRAYALAPTKNPSLLRGALKSQEAGKVQPIVSHHPLSLMSESYQAICTALLFSQPERAPRTILITSSQPQEGKTVTAINVAATLARHGTRVLLIDADLRNGNCHKRLGLQNGNGLANALTGSRNVMDLIKDTSTTNLSLLSRGEISPNPAELLGSMKMRELLGALETSFGFIIIDSAPLLPISDSVLLSTKVDGVVLVIKGKAASRYVVRRACERLAYVRAKILGVILSNININDPEYREYRSSCALYYTSYNAPDK